MIRVRSMFGACAAAFMLGGVCLVAPGRAAAPTGATQAQDEVKEPKPDLKPEVLTLLKQSTAVYSAMRSYRHISEYIEKGQGQGGEVNRASTFTLALERPNKFCYKSDSADGSAAVSDGKTFINYKDKAVSSRAMPGRQHTYYTKVIAPASYKGINIVDDVTFHFGSYFVALMLQGDVLADREVGAALEGAIARLGVEENGKKYDVLTVTFPGHATPEGNTLDTTSRFYFDAATHLLRRTISTVSQESVTETEIMENVLIDKPIPAATFEYSPPKSARWIVGLPARRRGQTASAASFPLKRLDVGDLLTKPDACSGPSF